MDGMIKLGDAEFGESQLVIELKKKKYADKKYAILRPLSGDSDGIQGMVPQELSYVLDDYHPIGKRYNERALLSRIEQGAVQGEVFVVCDNVGIADIVKDVYEKVGEKVFG